jgi:hypothetical protein
MAAANRAFDTMFWIVIVFPIQGPTRRRCLPKASGSLWCSSVCVYGTRIDVSWLENGKQTLFGKETDEAVIWTENQMRKNSGRALDSSAVAVPDMFV